jgi:hypothetical protein
MSAAIIIFSFLLQRALNNVLTSEVYKKLTDAIVSRIVDLLCYDFALRRVRVNVAHG